MPSRQIAEQGPGYGHTGCFRDMHENTLVLIEWLERIPVVRINRPLDLHALEFLRLDDREQPAACTVRDRLLQARRRHRTIGAASGLFR